MRRAKGYLEALRLESEAIDYQLRALDTLKARLDGLTAILSPDRSPNGQIHHQDRIGAYTALVVDSERELKERLEAFARKRRKVTDTLLAMEDDRHANLLLLRYVECEPWQDVAAALRISTTWAYTLHNRALKEFENLFYN